MSIICSLKCVHNLVLSKTGIRNSWRLKSHFRYFSKDSVMLSVFETKLLHLTCKQWQMANLKKTTTVLTHSQGKTYGSFRGLSRLSYFLTIPLSCTSSFFLFSPPLSILAGLHLLSFFVSIGVNSVIFTCYRVL